MAGLLKANRLRINEELRGAEKRSGISPAALAAHLATLEAIRSHARGAMLDVGCGDMPYKDLLPESVRRYDTLDREARSQGVTYVGDAEDMRMVPGASYDSAVCLQVLEHVPHPARAMAEIHRVLKPGGTLIVSAPHLSRLHEQPRDFYRYTEHGLRVLLDEAGFADVKVQPYGGIFCFAGHQVATLALCLCWHVPLVKRIVFWLNKWLCVRPCVFLDRVLDRNHLAPLGYVCVARKA